MKSSRLAKDFATVCKRMAEPPESFSHRCKTHNVVSFQYQGERVQFSYANTPSDRNSFRQHMRKFSAVANDLGWPDERVFKGKKELRSLCKRNDQ